MNLASIKKWNYQHAGFMLAAGLLTLLFQVLFILPLIAISSFSIFLVKYTQQSKAFGYANWVTSLRLVLLLLLGFFIFQIPAWVSLALGIVVLILDGLDGYLARKFDDTTDFGAYLDMETDTFFVCLFCTYYYLNEQLGGWVLAVGYMRYIYVGLILLFKLQGRKEKSTRFAKTIAVILFSALLMPLVLPSFLYQPAMIIATVLVLYSFGLSFIGLWSKNN